MQLDRHQIVDVDPAAWPAVVAAHPTLGTVPELRDWAVLGRPLIARRQLCEDPAASIPLGLPLPPSMGKQRLAVTVPPEAVLYTRRPPLLIDMSAVGPTAWRKVIAALVAADADTRCFGSLAWEHLTGLPYLSITSDIDLLWSARSAREADALVFDIARIDADAPMRIDGELILPDGIAVQWREWASGAPEVLAKAWGGTQLMARDGLLA